MFIVWKDRKGLERIERKLTDMTHEKWCITTNVFENEIFYLAYQDPAWDEDGYYWTSRENFEKVIWKSTIEHPFLFNTREEAIELLKLINIPQKYRIVRYDDNIREAEDKT